MLNLVAANIKEMFQEGQTYRYGGDEFLMILTNGTEAEYRQKISKWQKSIPAIKIPEVTIPLTCSSGYTWGIPQNIAECREMIKDADDSLYEAKKSVAKSS